jgi:hypothetical protein
MKNYIKIKPVTATVYLSTFPSEAELADAEAKKERLEDAGYNLVRATANELVYRLPC